MKRLILITAAALLFLKSSGQTSVTDSSLFDSKGRLTKIIPEISNTGNKIPTASLNALRTEDSIEKKKARDLLLSKVQESIRIIKSNYYKRSLHEFYLHLWSADSITLLNYLTYIETSLKTGIAASNNDPLYQSFIVAFSAHLSNNTIATFSSRLVKNNTGLQLWKTNPFNNFLIDYYNSTYQELSSDATIKLAKEDIIESTYMLILQKNELDAISKKLTKRYKEIKEFSKPLYDSLIEVHTNFTNSSTAYSLSMDMLKKSIFKNWFWLRGGEIRFNPLDGSIDAYLKKNEKQNLLDSAIFYEVVNNRYSMILENRLDSLQALQAKGDSLLYLTDKLINSITIPEKNSFYSYSAIPDIKFGQGKKYLEKTLHTGQNKTMAVHNILTGTKTGILEKNNAFTDRSPFQDGLDSVISQLGQLAALYAKFSPYGAALDFIMPQKKLTTSKISYPPSKLYDKMDVNDETGEKLKINFKFKINPFLFSYTDVNAKKYFNQLLMDEMKYNELFDPLIFASVFIEDETVEVVYRKQKKYVELVNSYLSKLTAKALYQIKLDSFYLTSILNIYNRSTLPPSPIIKIADSNYIYYSKIFETTPSDKAVEKEITLFNAKGTDTTFIGKFSYKVGQYYRVKLSGGIAYTLTPYNQSVAKQDANGITITNNVRLYRLILGIHYYLGKGLYNQSTKFWGKNSERTSIFLGVGVPDPLGNIYVGLSRDVLPGLKLTAGGHVVKNNRYLITNNSIIEEKTRYQIGGPFVAIQIDPTSLLNILNAFK